jgi:hypothetical protein
VEVVEAAAIRLAARHALKTATNKVQEGLPLPCEKCLAQFSVQRVHYKYIYSDWTNRSNVISYQLTCGETFLILLPNNPEKVFITR